MFSPLSGSSQEWEEAGKRICQEERGGEGAELFVGPGAQKKKKKRRKFMARR